MNESTDPHSLTDFLLARIAEDEAEARAAIDAMSRSMLDGRVASRLGDPARVLAECEAKRRIVERYADHNTLFDHVVKVIRPASDVYDYTDGALWGLELALCHLASAYSDHPDYRSEWKP